VNRYFFNGCRNPGLVIIGWLCLHTTAAALPFGTFDARTMAMGGVGVATGTRNAVFNNPALLTTADEVHEWALLLPTLGHQLDDTDDLKDNLDKFNQAADNLDVPAVQQSLAAIKDSQFRETKNSAIMLAIPSRILSGAFFLNSYEISNVQPYIDPGDEVAPADPYSSTLTHRGVRIIENGVSAARALEADSGWKEDLAIGFSAKFLLIKTYGYTESLRTAEAEINDATGNNDSQFALDVGLLKEIGVWKIGLVAKNLIPKEYVYGNTQDKIKIEPQVRAGFAYQSRRSVLELNIDLTKNQPVGFDSQSQIAAIGWEWQPWHSFALRAGYSKNLITPKNSDTKSTGATSLGIGLKISGVHLDVAGYTSDEGDGISGQFGLQF